MDMPRRAILCLVCLPLSLPVQAAPLSAANDPETVSGTFASRGDSVDEAWLILPTRRYDHFVRGNSSEAGGLRLRLKDGAIVTLTLDSGHVFEDNLPRLADFDGDGEEEIALVLTALDRGSSLAILKVAVGEIRVLAQTPYIGRPHRWLNPAGIADFNGDGRLDIALVQMPHLEKRLELWSLDEGALKRWAQVPDVANHRLGSTETGMSAVADFDGDGLADLAIPDGARTSLRFVGFAGGKPLVLYETPLPAPADGNFRLSSGPSVEVKLETGASINVAYGGQRDG